MRKFIRMTPEMVKAVKNEALMEAMREYNRWPSDVEVAEVAELVGQVLLPKVRVKFPPNVESVLLTVRVPVP